MKKSGFFICSAIFLGILNVFIGCKKVSNKPQNQVLPVSLLEKPGYIICNTFSIVPGEVMKLAWKARKISQNLKTFAITVDGANLKDYNSGVPKNLSTGQDSVYIDSITTTAPAKPGSYWYYLTATDNNGNHGSNALHVIVTAPVGGPIYTYACDIRLGGDIAKGSFFSTRDGAIYSEADAEPNSGKVDFVYFCEPAFIQNMTIAAPNDSSAGTVYPGLQTWNTKNATLFNTTSLTIDQFLSFTGDQTIVDNVKNPTATKISNFDFMGNTVFGFLTANGKKGLLWIKAGGVTDTGNYIDISVKVQQ
jgi:hypothetical protein